MIEYEFAEPNSEMDFWFDEPSDFDYEFAGEVIGSGTSDHSLLKNRELPDQHPIQAVTGLEERLNEPVVIPITNMELEALLK